MKVVCDNCRAVYKVPDEKLTKAVNKATCRNCGHRMLIPRPKPNADPDERTLVTAVPPTPVGAPPRAIRESGADDLRVGTPMVSARVDQTLSQPEDDFDDAPDTKLAVHPPDGARPQPSRGRAAPVSRGGNASMGGSMSRSPSPSSRSRSGDSHHGHSHGHSQMKLPPARSGDSLAGINPQANSMPAALPGPVNTSTPPPSRRTPGPAPRSTPPPAASRSRSGTYPAMALHDPAGDLNWALLGTSTALVGGFLLAFLSVWNHPLVMWFGLAMTFGGGLLSFMVLLTGARGRRPARTFLSVVLGFVFAMVISTTLVATKWSAERLIDAYDIRFSNAALGNATTADLEPRVAAPLPAPLPVAEPAPAAPAAGDSRLAAAEPAPPAPPRRDREVAPAPARRPRPLRRRCARRLPRPRRPPWPRRRCPIPSPTPSRPPSPTTRPRWPTSRWT
ncbi:MAG: zinc-ribbon domain-containing protein [Myxococcota bacterium]